MTDERKIILIGKTGNGKSSTGNTLLGYRAFSPGSGLNAMTQTCKLKKGSRGNLENNTIRYYIVDTPGLMDTEVKLADRLLEIQRSVSADICPEPHAFLLILSSVNRMTKDEKFTIDLLRVAFGEKVFDHCIVVFTNGGRFKTDQEFKHYWEESEMVKKLVEMCGGRIARIENCSPSGQSDYEGTSKIIEIIDEMSRRGTIVYQYKYIEKHREVILEYTQSYDGKRGVREELSDLVISLGKVLSAQTWKVMLVRGTLATVIVAGLGAAGYGTYVAAGAALELTASTSWAAAAGSAVVGAARSLATKIRFWYNKT